MVLNMGQNLVELSQYRDHFPALRTLRNYWNNLADGGVPYRSDLDPRGLSDALRSVVLMERISTGNARSRISGRYLCDALQEDGRGLPQNTMAGMRRRHLERKDGIVSPARCLWCDQYGGCGELGQRALGTPY